MRRQRPEQIVHKAVVAHLLARGERGCVWWHCPNGGARSKVEAAIFAGLGVKAGVADLCILHDGRFYALELKAPGGRSTAAQLAFRDAVNAAGGFASEAVGLDAAIHCLEAWGLLRGTAALGERSRNPPSHAA
jgi:hypothetical protein